MAELSRRKFFKLAAATGAAAAAGPALSAAVSFIEDRQGSWVVADGGALPVARYRDLYAVIGNTYGGDAVTFMLPHLCEDNVAMPDARMVPLRFLMKAIPDKKDMIMPVGSVVAWVGNKLP